MLDKIETLTNWVNEQGQWTEDYQEHKDNIDDYGALFEGYNLFYGEIDIDIRDHTQSILDSLSANEIYDLCDLEYTHGISCRTNEIWSTTIGEIETQLTGIYDSETGSYCVFTDLCKGLTEKKIKQALDHSEYFVSGDCLYHDFNYNRISLILDIDKLQAYVANYVEKKEKEVNKPTKRRADIYLVV